MSEKKPTLREYLDEKLKSNSLKAPDRNPLIAPQADLAKKVKALLNQYETKKLGKIDSPWNKYGAGHSIGDLLFGQSPELLDDISYGLNPFTSGGKYGRLPIPDKRLLDIPVPTPSTGGLGVIKNKGGNWLTGSVENALKGLKHNAGMVGITPQEYRRDVLNGRINHTPEEHADAVSRLSGDLAEPLAINDWIDNTLTKYVKNRMATPDDEVRKLADQGILHVSPENLGSAINPTVVRRYRETFGFNPHGTETNTNSLSDLWEDSADGSLIPSRAGFLASEHIIGGPKNGTYPNLETDPWLAKIDPNEPVYRIPRDSQPEYNLGFSHLIDELLNAANPDSGLPMNLRMKPEGFKGLSMEEAVRKVHGINKFRAEQAKKVNERFAQAEGIPVYKDYGDGTRLLEYRLPEQLDKLPNEIKIEGDINNGFKYVYPDGRKSPPFDTKEEVISAAMSGPAQKHVLDSWLKQEGDTMGHCVGGYCDAVTSGRSRILSLRDKEGKSRATIELRPEKKIKSPFDFFDKYHPEGYNNYKFTGDYEADARMLKEDPLWIKYQSDPDPISIYQIKGPGNRAPDPDVLPYLQDFVKSGNWSDVADLQNTGLERLSDYKDSVIKRAREAGLEGDYFTPNEIYQYLDPGN